jgi:hypothetical protein
MAFADAITNKMFPLIFRVLSNNTSFSIDNIINNLAIGLTGASEINEIFIVNYFIPYVNSDTLSRMYEIMLFRFKNYLKYSESSTYRSVVENIIKNLQPTSSSK